MKEIVLRFLETQNLSTILVEIAALFTAWQGWRKYQDEKKNNNKSRFLKSLKGTDSVNEILNEMQGLFVDRMIIPAVLEITNGGGIPKHDSPLYLKALNSTNSEILDLWGAKSLIVPAMVKSLIHLNMNSTSFLDMENFQLKKVDFWSGAKNIQRVHYFSIGTKSRASIVLAINIESQEELTDDELLIAYSYANKIKDELNLNKRFWQEKIR